MYIESTVLSSLLSDINSRLAPGTGSSATLRLYDSGNPSDYVECNVLETQEFEDGSILYVVINGAADMSNANGNPFNYHTFGADLDCDTWGLYDGGTLIFEQALSPSINIPEYNEAEFTNGGYSGQTIDSVNVSSFDFLIQVSIL